MDKHNRRPRPDSPPTGLQDISLLAHKKSQAWVLAVESDQHLTKVRSRLPVESLLPLSDLQRLSENGHSDAQSFYSALARLSGIVLE